MFSFSLDKYPEVELLGFMVALFLIFWGTSVLFSIVVVPVYIPTNSGGGFPFFHILSAFIIYKLFNDGHSDQCEVVSHYDFNLYFSNN